jgi:hypothetical protein
MLKTSNVFLRHLPRSFSTKVSPKGVTLNKDKDKDSLKSKAGSKAFYTSNFYRIWFFL